jgi:hypothetical protein
MEGGYAVAFVEADDIFAYGFNDTGDVTTGVGLFAEPNGDLPILGVGALKV